MRKLFIIIPILFSFVACGGDDNDSSGVDQDKQISALSSDEQMSLCTWSIDSQGGEGHVTECGDDVTVTTGSVSDCVTDLALYAECGISVAELEDCSNDLADEPCDPFSSTACAAVFECIL